MKVYIHTDIEGIAGWVFYTEFSNTIFNYHHVQRMNQLLTDEVNAAAKAAFEAGATEVYINDNHGYCYNILFEQLDPRCQVIIGRGGYAPSWLPLLDESFDAAIGIGMHAMAATPGAVCPHSYWHVTLGNGEKIALSECTMFAALAGEKGVPVVAVSGDDKIAMEINEKLPDCETAIVKTGLAAQNCCTLVPARACELIAEKVKLGLAKYAKIAPYKLAGPYKLSLSNRDPAVLQIVEVEGDDLWTLMHDSCREFNNWGEQPIDDGSWRFPRDIFNK
ncbi:MAG: M55 family metallopeptidase [Victivallaceae bacterium]|nr:M55 family metallopeptidase [Victivallaceae bacterium]